MSAVKTLQNSAFVTRVDLLNLTSSNSWILTLYMILV